VPLESQFIVLGIQTVETDRLFHHVFINSVALPGGIAFGHICWLIGSFVIVFICSLTCFGAKYLENVRRQMLSSNGPSIGMAYGESNVSGLISQKWLETETL